MNRKTKRAEPEDDGHVIAPMNVEGMPWYRPEQLEDRMRNASAGSGEKSDLSPAERRLVVWGAVRTGLLIFSVFAVVFLLFLLFSDYVWFGN